MHGIKHAKVNLKVSKVLNACREYLQAAFCLSYIL